MLWPGIRRREGIVITDAYGSEDLSSDGINGLVLERVERSECQQSDRGTWSNKAFMVWLSRVDR